MPKNLSNFKVENIAISELRPHPQNYRIHPQDEIEHLMESIKSHGIYRNVVIAREGTILAGHGVVEAVRKIGLESIPVIRLDLDPLEIRALKVLTGDNEIAHLSEINDRALSEILKEINDIDIDGLLGTGYDEKMLANLIFTTRPASEIKDFDEAAEWVGLPEYEEGNERLKIVISFRNEADRTQFIQRFDIEVPYSRKGSTWSFWWPFKEQEDRESLRFEAKL